MVPAPRLWFWYQTGKVPIIFCVVTMAIWLGEFLDRFVIRYEQFLYGHSSPARDEANETCCGLMPAALRPANLFAMLNDENAGRMNSANSLRGRRRQYMTGRLSAHVCVALRASGCRAAGAAAEKTSWQNASLTTRHRRRCGRQTGFDYVARFRITNRALMATYV